jgi:hypothetical protein
MLHHEFRMRNAWTVLMGHPRHASRSSSQRDARRRSRRLRSLAAVAFHGAALPLARLQLEILARVRRPDLPPLPRFMTPEAAAHPTPQPDASTRS